MLTGIKNFKAFTLAEVLITLGIIGVVAALTIPTVLSNYQKQQYITGLKKAYSTFNEVLAKIAADKGCLNDLKCTGIFDTTTTQQSLGDELVKYFNVAKNCETSDNSCFSTNINWFYDGKTGSMPWLPSNYSFITADGIAFLISNFQTNCDVEPNEWSNYITNNMTQVCASLYVDVNGPQKGPNFGGRDVFLFYISNGKGALLYPSGGADCATASTDGPWQDISTKDYISCDPTNTDGQGCAGRIVEEGWEMNY